MFKALSTLLLAASVPVFAQVSQTYPRTVLRCTMTEGGAEFREENPGVFSYNASFGFTGDNTGGTAKIELKKSLDKCVLNITAGEKSKKIITSFNWSIEPNGLPGSINEPTSQDGDCKFQPRYSKSFAQCILPTEKEPGFQCHSEAGKDLTALLPMVLPKRKVTAYAGGMTIETDENSKKGFALWRNSKDKKSWCFELDTLFPSRCKKLESRQEIKNSDGKVIGVIELQGEAVNFKSAMKPYESSGYRLDSSIPILRIANTESETSVIAIESNGRNIGEMKIVGAATSPSTFKSFNRPPVDMAKGETFTSDCNGLILKGETENVPVRTVR